MLQPRVLLNRSILIEDVPVWQRCKRRAVQPELIRSTPSCTILAGEAAVVLARSTGFEVLSFAMCVCHVVRRNNSDLPRGSHDGTFSLLHEFKENKNAFEACGEPFAMVIEIWQAATYPAPDPHAILVAHALMLLSWLPRSYRLS